MLQYECIFEYFDKCIHTTSKYVMISGFIYSFEGMIKYFCYVMSFWQHLYFSDSLNILFFTLKWIVFIMMYYLGKVQMLQERHYVCHLVLMYAFYSTIIIWTFQLFVYIFYYEERNLFHYNENNSVIPGISQQYSNMVQIWMENKLQQN